LIKGGRYLEAAARLRALAIDKTGTLTSGIPKVASVVPFDDHTHDELLQRAAALEKHSTHPIGQAIVEHAEKAGIASREAENHRTLTGSGEEATFEDRTFWIGSQRLLHARSANSEKLVNQASEMEETGSSIVAIGCEDHVCGLISLDDTVREEAITVMAELRKLGVEYISMVTGDHPRAAEAIATAVGVDSFSADQMPADKAAKVEALRERYGSVAMIGDGVNDAPALAAATVGIAMGAIGSDAAIETADVALMSDDLSRIPWLILHARRALAVIKQNVAFALGLKLLFIALTAVGLGSLWMAIAADTGASLLVIFNGMRLLRS
jgi:Cd2+/Zn2+-exporting ATPase